MKSRIILVNPPAKKYYQRDQYCTGVSKNKYYWPPVDLIVQSGILAEHFDVDLLDCIQEEIDADAALRRIAQGKYDGILFLTCYGSIHDDLAFLAKAKLGRPGLLTLGSGGVLLDHSSSILAQHPEVDGILSDYTTTGSASFFLGKEKSVGVMTRTHPIQERSVGAFAIPPPRHDLFLRLGYETPWNIHRRSTCVITSVGCPFKCGFCYTANFAYRERDVANLEQELDAVVRAGARDVHVFDQIFGMSLPRLKAIAALFKARKLSWSCLSRVDILDEEKICIMADANCHTILFGLESGNNATLERYNKGFTIATAEKTVRLCQKHSIRPGGFFILGLPGEGRAEVLATIEYAIRLNCTLVSFELPMPVPKTMLALSATENTTGEIDTFDDATELRTLNDAIAPAEHFSLLTYANKHYYFRISYMLNLLLNIRSPYELVKITKLGTRFAWDVFGK